MKCGLSGLFSPLKIVQKNIMNNTTIPLCKIFILLFIIYYLCQTYIWEYGWLGVTSLLTKQKHKIDLG